TRYLVRLSYTLPKERFCKKGRLIDSVQQSIEISEEDYKFMYQHLIVWENPPLDPSHLPAITIDRVYSPIDSEYRLSFEHVDPDLECGAKPVLELNDRSARIWIARGSVKGNCDQGVIHRRKMEISISKHEFEL